jgi:hypothetical protein
MTSLAATQQYLGSSGRSEHGDTMMPHRQSRGGFLMKFTATHEPPRDVGRL